MKQKEEAEREKSGKCALAKETINNLAEKQEKMCGPYLKCGNMIDIERNFGVKDRRSL